MLHHVAACLITAVGLPPRRSKVVSLHPGFPSWAESRRLLEQLRIWIFETVKATIDCLYLVTRIS